MTRICSTCGRHIPNPGGHTCPPTWLVRHHYSLVNDWSVVYAYNPESAACEFISREDAESVRFTPASIVLVVANDGATHDPLQFEVFGELVPSYSATPATKEAAYGE